jgi:hypothetical protein
MARVTVGAAYPDADTLKSEISRVSDLSLGELKARWQTAFRRKPPPQLSRHLIFRMLAYRLQAEQLGDLPPDILRIVDAASPEDAGKGAIARDKEVVQVKPGTVLGREWNGAMHRVAVVNDGFAWNGKTYASLSKVALAITGTRWNGPRFFGLRGKTGTEARP